MFCFCSQESRKSLLLLFSLLDPLSLQLSIFLALPRKSLYFFFSSPPCTFIIVQLSLSSFISSPHPFRYSIYHPLSSVQRKSPSQPPPWQGGGVLGHTSHATLSTLGEVLPHFSKKCLVHSPVAEKGFTNMLIFGRVHECKEYKHWSEKKV